MNFEDAFVDPEGKLKKLKEELFLEECNCSSCRLNNSIIKWYKFPGTIYSVTYFGVFIFSKEHYPHGLLPHSNYISLEDLLSECQPNIQDAIIFNLNILTSKG